MRIAIIGGSGKMGRWFTNFLLKENNEVIITGRDQSKLLEAKRQLGVEATTNQEAAKEADVIVISVPIDNFETVVEEISPHTHDDQLIFDITSVKTLPVETMHKYIKSGLTLGVHPMFGPGANNLINQNFALTPTNEKERALAQKVKIYLETKGANVTLMSPKEHDEIMAIVLGLSHFVALVSADTLISLGKPKGTKTIGSITYKVLLTLIESVVSEDPEFYASLQMSLPNMAEIEKLFQTKAKMWTELVEKGDRQQFIQKMSLIKSKLKQDNANFGKAYENMYKLASGL